MRPSNALFTGLMAAASLPIAVQGQTPMPTTLRCDQCDLVMSTVAVLRGDSVGFPLTVVGSDSLFAVVPASNTATVQLFDQTGGFIRTLDLGGFISAVQFIDGGLDVFDRVGREWKRIALASGEMVQAIDLAAIPTSRSTRATPEGGVLVGGTGVTPSSIGFGVLNLRPDGSLGRFRAAEGVDSNGRTNAVVFDIWEGQIWTMRQGDLQVEIWSPAGELVDVISREVFRTDFDKGRVTDIAVIEPGQLWVKLSVPKVEPSLSQSRNEGLDPTHTVDTVLEVVDITERRSIAQFRFKRLIGGFVQPSTVYTYDQVEGQPVIHIWRLTLTKEES